METVERWWNGTWGRLARRDLWLLSDGTSWAVRVRIGSADSPTADLPFDDEPSARSQLDMLLSEHGPWTELTGQR